MSHLWPVWFFSVFQTHLANLIHRLPRCSCFSGTPQPPSSQYSEPSHMISPHTLPDLPIFYMQRNAEQVSPIAIALPSPDRQYCHFENFFSEPPMTNNDDYPNASETYWSREQQAFLEEFCETVQRSNGCDNTDNDSNDDDDDDDDNDNVLTGDQNGNRTLHENKKKPIHSDKSLKCDASNENTSNISSSDLANNCSQSEMGTRSCSLISRENYVNDSMSQSEISITSSDSFVANYGNSEVDLSEDVTSVSHRKGLLTALCDMFVPGF